tara:strand:- start:73 stop:813 length:741 start_codon:yes stop_codon:yes gene_type:complete
MKKYNSNNYSIYKKDVKNNQPTNKDYWDYTRTELIVKFLPLVENLARKFSTSKQAIGIMNLSDLIQDGNLALVKAVDKITWQTIKDSKDHEKTLKSFLSKRIKGAIRRGIDKKRGTMRIPEHKINDIRKSKNKDESNVFFNSVFSSLDEIQEQKPWFDVQQDESILHNGHIEKFLLEVTEAYLNKKEKQVLRYSFGLNCEKLSAKEIAERINIKGDSAYVRVSQLKKQALDKLRDKLKHSQVIDIE